MAAQTDVPVANDAFIGPRAQNLSLLHGPTDPPLVDLTLGELLNLQCLHHGTQECLTIPWTGARWTYNELNHQSCQIARALLAMGVGTGDRVGIMAGNCEQYAAIFFAATRIGAILVILNNTYTATEAQYALGFSGKKDLTWPCAPVADGHWIRVQASLHNQEHRAPGQPKTALSIVGRREWPWDNYTAR